MLGTGKQVLSCISWWERGCGGGQLCPCWRPFQRKGRPFSVWFPVCDLAEKWGWHSPDQLKIPTSCARTYWAWLTHWSWSCRGLCPRSGRVGSHSLSRLLEMILKWVTTRLVIPLQAVNLRFPLCPDLGHLVSISPGLKYWKISSGWKPKATTWVPLATYHLPLTRCAQGRPTTASSEFPASCLCSSCHANLTEVSVLTVLKTVVSAVESHRRGALHFFNQLNSSRVFLFHIRHLWKDFRAQGA